MVLLFINLSLQVVYSRKAFEQISDATEEKKKLISENWRGYEESKVCKAQVGRNLLSWLAI